LIVENLQIIEVASMANLMEIKMNIPERDKHIYFMSMLTPKRW
jgi:hypothetical protein